MAPYERSGSRESWPSQDDVVDTAQKGMAP